MAPLPLKISCYVIWLLKSRIVAVPLDALPACAVIVLAQADKQYRVLAERLNPIPKLASLPLPPRLGRRMQSHQPAPMTPKARAPSRPHGDTGEAAVSAAPVPTVGERGDADKYF